MTRHSVLVPLALASVLALLPSHAISADTQVSLPAPNLDGEVSVEAALAVRRSIRSYADTPLSIKEISQFLWSAQGKTHRRGYRTAPSAGALYPLELYVIAGDVDGLAPGLYRYRPDEHELRLVRDGDPRRQLATAALDQDWVRRAPAVLVFTGVFERTAAKYGSRAVRYVHIEVGHAAQNVYLQAASLNLGAVFVGAFRDSDVVEALGLPRSHAPLGLMPLGHVR